MKDAVERMKYIEGEKHAIITPYIAQVNLLLRQRDYAAQAAAAIRHEELAKQLMNIEITTIDCFMGKDKFSVTVDTTGVIGHLFQHGRIVVAATRARVSKVFIGPTLEFTSPVSKLKADHPIAKVVRQLNKTKRIKAMSIGEIEALEQYHKVLH
ncbi:hypothetical protein ACJQWK_03369 [Exserohilum turcicum]